MGIDSTRISLRRRFDPAVSKALLKGLIDYNEQKTGLRSYRYVQLAARDRKGRVIGALEGGIWYGWLFIKLLWVDEASRHGGIGRRLIARAEAEAVRQGCVGAWLDTFSFQARPFYERLGYRLFGTIDGYPPGHKRFFLQKRLKAPARSPARGRRKPGL
ncbi:MAG: GNAT family N-acetyltransferase [Alphaproteobacteria bacterium]|nr:GNAT family N-acetyltransferase [Alphaproteobacteria bacterium]